MHVKNNLILSIRTCIHTHNLQAIVCRGEWLQSMVAYQIARILFSRQYPDVSIKAAWLQHRYLGNTSNNRFPSRTLHFIGAEVSETLNINQWFCEQVLPTLPLSQPRLLVLHHISPQTVEKTIIYSGSNVNCQTLASVLSTRHGFEEQDSIVQG